MTDDFKSRLIVLKEEYENCNSGQADKSRLVWIESAKIIREINIPDDQLMHSIIEEINSYLRNELQLDYVRFLKLTKNSQK